MSLVAPAMRIELVGWAAVLTVCALVAAAERSSILLELLHAHGRQCGGGMVLCGVVVDLMDGLGGVDNVRLDSFYARVSIDRDDFVRRIARTLLHDRLDRLVDVMMHMLATDGRGSAAGVLALNARLCIFVLILLGSKTLLHPAGIIVLVGTFLCRQEIVMVLLWERLLVVHWLLSGVVVILVNLTIDRSGLLVMLRAVDGFLLDRWRDLLVDGCVVVAIT